MLTLPDFREKQILFVQPELGKEYKLRIKNQNIAYEEEGKVVNQLACSKVLAIFVLGDISFTSVLLRECLENGVSVFFLKRNFQVYATIGAEAAGNYLLRERQYHISAHRQEWIAKHIVKNKMRNQLALLYQNGVRTIGAGAMPIAEYQSRVEHRVDETQENQKLLGQEGELSKVFFTSYFGEIGWRRRVPRGKTDPENILLDIGYTILFNYVDSLLRLFGFDTYKGVYHKLFFQRKSLACDLEEPFRCLIERKLLKMYHLGQVDKGHFVYYPKRNQYVLQYTESSRYAQLFTEAILEEKEQIFGYIKAYYYAMLNETEDFPVFELGR